MIAFTGDGMIYEDKDIWQLYSQPAGIFSLFGSISDTAGVSTVKPDICNNAQMRQLTRYIFWVQSNSLHVHHSVLQYPMQ